MGVLFQCVCIECGVTFTYPVQKGKHRQWCDACVPIRRSRQGKKTVTAYAEARKHQPVNWDDNGPRHIYVCSSPWIPGLVKVGGTLVDPLYRLRRTTAIPGPVLEAAWRESAPWSLESRIHAALRAVRLPGQEWFQVSAQEVISMVEGWRSTECPRAEVL